MNNRYRLLNNYTEIKKGQEIIYLMSRDQRVNDNWALIFANNLCLKNNCILKVIFCINPSFLNATSKHYDFMLSSLKKVEKDLEKLNIEFKLLYGKTDIEIIKYLNNNSVSSIVTDFDPLKIKRDFINKINKIIKIPFYEVDAHNIVPVWLASSKQEYGAYTIRPKINNLLNNFLIDYPKIKKLNKKIITNNNWKKIKEIKDSGERKANEVLKDFIENKLNYYSIFKNDPTKEYVSNLSKYLHFGQISSQRVALEVIKSKTSLNSKNAFLEELIIRKELADNYCFYNINYDNFNGFPDWAKKTLNEHRIDKREYIYSLKDLESAKTHDQLWNASQKEMLTTGKMHGYLRMYWAKKILEWTESPEIAQKYSIYLNNKYQFDGRDSNGYVGIAWSIGGVHDRAWGERGIFGKVRYMSYNSIIKKFNYKAYLQKYL